MRRGLLGRTIVVAPMAGGPSTPELVVAAGEAGALAFLAGGYKTADAVRAEISAVRSRTAAPFGVNVFVPGAPADAVAVDAYLATLAGDAAELGVELAPASWDDDHWETKVEVLLAESPPVVSFTFGCPPRELVSELNGAGSIVVVTVTTPEETEAAAACGARWVCTQGHEAGAHRGSHDNDPSADHDWATIPLVVEIARRRDVGIIASGGITTAAAVQAVLTAGADAVQAGTAFLLCPEAGTHPVHRAALADPANTSTRVTRAFSGRRARSIANRFIAEHADAPPAYPEVNNATRPLRAAAAAAGDTSRMSLWAGQSFRAAQARAAGEVVAMLGAERTQ